MDAKEIKSLIREIVGARPNLPFTATVIAVQDETCTIKMAGGLELTDVKLSATVDESENYYKVSPKEGTKVLVVSLTGDLDNLTVIKIDEANVIEFKQNGLNVMFDSTDKKVLIENENVNLKDLFDDLKTLLMQFQVYTPAGPSGTPLPTTITSLQQLSVKVNQLLK